MTGAPKCNCCGLVTDIYIPIRPYEHDVFTYESLCPFCMLINHTPDSVVETVRLYGGMVQWLNKGGAKLYGRS